MSRSAELLQRRAAVVAAGVPRVSSATVASASGAILNDLDGNELIDFAGGIGVLNVGHCNPAVVKAIQDQAARLLHTCIHVATYEPYIELCETLAELLPHGRAADEGTKVMLVNSGAEAVENAIKIARQATGRPAIICYTEGFHGRTLLGMSLTSKTGYKLGSGPYAPEIYRLPFPNHYHYGDGLSLDDFVQRELARLRAAFTNTVAAEQVAAILIEPVQGEGGIVPAPNGYMQGLRQICDDHGIMLIADEVQTGFCRTARWAAFEHYGIRPDISTWAKSMGGGLPIGAVVGRASVMDAARPGTIGGTYGGNPVSCAAALATIASMRELDLNKRAAAIGKIVHGRFRQLAERCDAIGDVRALGAMVGLELVEDRATRRPASAMAASVMAACVQRGVLIIGAGAHGNVLRILSPLVISDAELERGLGILEEEILRYAGAAPAHSGNGRGDNAKATARAGTATAATGRGS